MKKLTVILAVMILGTQSGYSQINWDGDNPIGNFDLCSNYYSDACPLASDWNSSNDLFFSYRNNAVQTSVYLNIGYKTIRSVYFDNTFSASTIIDADAFSGFDLWYKIENNSSFTQTINVPVFFQGIGSEFNPVNADLIINSAIGNNARNLLIYGDNSKLITFNNVVSGSGKFAIKQYSKALFNAAQTYTGNTEIDKGELWLASNGSISGSSAVYLGNGGLTTLVAKIYAAEASGGKTYSNNINVNLGNSGTRYIGGLNSSGTNTFSGSIPIAAGGNLTLDAVAAGGTTNFSGLISGTAAIISQGAGIINISGASANTYTGGTTLSSGTLVLNKTANLQALGTGALGIGTGTTLRTDAVNQFGSGTPPLVTIAGTGNFNGNGNSQKIALSGTGTVTMGTGTLTIDNTLTDTYSGIISGSGGLIKSNTGTQILSGVNTYSGSTAVNAGTLKLGASGVIPDASALVVASTFDMAGFTETVGSLAGAGSVTSSAAGTPTLTAGGDNSSTTFSGVMANGAGTTAFAKAGSGTLILSGSNTYTGATAVNAGVLNIQNATATGTTAGGVSVGNGAALQIQNNITVGAEALSLTGTGISNDGALRNISGTNTWQGTATLNGATIVQSDAGTLTLSSANSITATNQNLTLQGAGNGTISGTITTGTGTVTKAGAGTWTISGTGSTYTGATIISAGTLQLGAANVIADVSPVTLSGGSFSTGTGLAETVGTLSMSSSSSITLGAAAHTLTFTGSAASWTGTLTINGYVVGSTKIFIGASTILTATQLSQISFTGFASGAVQLTTGQVVPGGPIVVSGSTAQDGTYASLTLAGGAFAALNAASQAGKTILITITADVTTETGANALTGAAGQWNTLTINPSGARTISGNVAANLIDLNGADNVTIDGLNAGGNSLIISNLSTSGVNTSTIRFIADATSNTVQNCTISGSSTSTALGTILFATGTITGNIANTIFNNTITAAGGNTPTNAIYSAGTSAAIPNTVTVSGNNISDYFSAGSASSGVFVASNSSAWTITGNKFFQSATRTATAGSTHRAINIITANGGGYTISTNIIGYATSGATGTTTYAGVFANRFIGIELTANTTTSSIQGNTITAISLSTTSGATTAPGIFSGISILAGNVNVGTTTGNTIGATTGNSAISVTSSTSLAYIAGIYATSTGTVSIQNNNIGAISTGGTAAIGYTFYGINTAGAAGNFTISSNTIGSTSTTNSIAVGISGTTTAVCTFNGISNAATGTISVTGNTIQNCSSYGSGASVFAGISNTGGLASSTLSITTNNIISGTLSGTGTFTGISNSATVATANLNTNVIRSNTKSATTGTFTGIISTAAPTTALNINGNSLGNATGGLITYSAANSGTLTGISALTTAAAATLSISTNNFQGITHSVAGSSIHTYITYSHASSVTDNINTNTFTNLAVNTTGSVTFITRAGNMTATGVENCNSNSIVTGFNKTGAGNTVTLYYAFASSVTGSSMNETGNNFSNITVTGATTIAGWYNAEGASTTSGPAKTITGNTFNNWIGGSVATPVLTVDYSGNGTTLSTNNISSITGTAAITGILLGSNNNTTAGYSLSCSSNIINTLTSSGGGGAVIGIFSSSATPSITFASNTINGLSSTAASVIGISSSAGTTTKIYKNKIYTLSSSSVSALVYGIYINGGTTNNLYNNIIGDLTGTVATQTAPTPAVVGLYLNAGSTNNIYNNTVRITGAGGANFGTAALYANTSPTTLMNNNLLVNLCTPSGTGKTVAYQRSSTTAGTYSASSNKNSYYSGDATFSTASKPLFFDGTNNDLTLTALQTRFTQESGSLAENPTFASTTGSAGTFLHIPAGTTTLLESGGVNNPSSSLYTDDFDGDVRPGPAGSVNGGASSYDVGADEFDGIRITITLSPLTQSFGPFCNSSANAISLTYTVTGTIATPFIQLSNSSGSFLSGTTNLSSTIVAGSPNTISASIPSATAAGSYRIRIVSTDATPVTSSDNGSAITISSAPTALSISSGTYSVCTGNSYSYTATATGATSYLWSYSPSTGVTITNGTLATASLAYGVTAVSGNVSVSAINGACTTGPVTNVVTVNITPSQPSAISGSTSVDQGATGVGYSVTAVAGITYTWAYSGTGATISNNGSNSITIDYSNTATSGTLSVTPSTATCTGTAQTVAITCACFTPNALAFVSQPVSVQQDVAMTVSVKAYCTVSGLTATGYTGNITLTVFNGCGYTSQTATAVNGVATFSVIFTRSTQANVQLIASALGFTSVLSNTFNVTLPSGSSTVTTIKSETFETGETGPIWSWAAGTPTYTGSGGIAGGIDVVTIKPFSGNNSLVKSFSVDNPSGTKVSTNTITFANVAGLGGYTLVKLSFQIASLGLNVGAQTGAGTDANEYMTIQISLDGGGTWNNMLTAKGFSDHLFALSSASPVNLAYNANVTYSNGDTYWSQSAFETTLPSGTTQLQFRVTAKDNRTNENWAIDNIKLEGTIDANGVQFPLPTATGYTLKTCPGTDNAISVGVTNANGAITYAWSPNTNISSVTAQNPIVNPTVNTTYTVVVTDADKCTATAQVIVDMPSGTPGTWTGATDRDWYNCRNWGDGKVPTISTDVSVPNTASNTSQIDATSSYAATFGSVAKSKTVTSDGNTLSFAGATDSLYIASDLTIKNNGIIDMTVGGKIELQGNWINQVNTAGKGFLSGIGTVTFSGGSTQSITSVNSPELFYNLQLNKSLSSQLLNLTGNVTVDHNIGLTKGIITTGNKLLTWNNNGGSLTQPTNIAGGLYTDSYICTCTSLGDSLIFARPFSGAIGFRVNNVANALTWFPVGVDFKSPNRMMVQNTGTVDDLTVVLEKDDITSTAQPRVNRIWYVHQTNPATKNMQATMRLYFTKRDWTGWPLTEDEVESPFNYSDTRLVQKVYNDPNYRNVAQGVANNDIMDFVAASNGTEIYGQYTIGVSPDVNGVKNGIDSFTRFSVINISSFILPVTITNLRAWLQNNAVELSWTSVTETNIDHYDIERSVNGISFSSIGSRTALNNGSVQTNYGFTDLYPQSGKNYYRIKVVEKDGHISYTNIVLIETTGGKIQITIVPNPVINKKVIVQLANAPQGKYNVILYSANGQKTWQSSLLHLGGSSAYDFRLPASLAQGIYFMHVENENVQQVIKLVVE